MHRKSNTLATPVYYTVRMNAAERCHEVIVTPNSEVVASFYWDEARYFGQPGVEAQQLANRLNFATLTERRGVA